MPSPVLSMCDFEDWQPSPPAASTLLTDSTSCVMAKNESDNTRSTRCQSLQGELSDAEDSVMEELEEDFHSETEELKHEPPCGIDVDDAATESVPEELDLVPSPCRNSVGISSTVRGRMGYLPTPVPYAENVAGRPTPHVAFGKPAASASSRESSCS